MSGKLDAGLSAMGGKLDAGLSALDRKLDAGLRAVDGKLAGGFKALCLNQADTSAGLRGLAAAMTALDAR